MSIIILLVFILDYFQEKLISSVSKSKKKTYFGGHFGTFCPNFINNEFSRKNGLCQFLNILSTIV